MKDIYVRAHDLGFSTAYRILNEPGPSNLVSNPFPDGSKAADRWLKGFEDGWERWHFEKEWEQLMRQAL